MINELHQLSLAIQNANIRPDSWHRKYVEIPNIRDNAPCIRIVLHENQVPFIERLSSEKGKNIRKYGSNQGYFPAMNLACLYRINDEEDIKKLKHIKNDFQKDGNINEIKALCSHNNWNSSRFEKKYKQCMINVPNEMAKILQPYGYAPLEQLIDAIQPFLDPQILHAALTDRAFRMLEEKHDITTAFQLLYYEKAGELSDFGTLSVIFDTFSLEEQGNSAAGSNFTKGLNKALITAASQSIDTLDNHETDAFGKPYSPLDDPMPKIKLPAGFDVALRTMFKGQPCQFRYGNIENNTYPLSAEKRNEIKGALEWISSDDMKNKTWVSTNQDEVLFIYPDRLPKKIPGFTGMFAPVYEEQTGQSDFQAKAESFAAYITETKKYDPEDYPEHIQLFMLKKLDKARSKVIYSRLSSPEEIIRQSDIWQKAANNIPGFYGRQFRIPFPMKIADIMNRIWKQDGSLASDKFKPVKSYHGLEILFGLSYKEIEYDLQLLMRNTQKLAVYAGRFFNMSEHSDDRKIVNSIKSSIVLMGMFLYWLDSRKENYMNEYPYLLGQLLKVSDSLHELYCNKERDGNLPPQLVGGSMYMSAVEFPKQAISQLAQRMMPYLNWARTHQKEKAEYKRLNSDGTETNYSGPSAGYLLYLYTQIADKLLPVLTETTRFNDMDKASLFLGYLASFPKSSKNEESETKAEDIN